jgi:flagellar export protein FliJ
MRKFQFRFAPLLQHRKNLEERELRGLAAAQREHQLAMGHKRELESALAGALGRREALGSDAPAPAIFFSVEQDFITGTKQRIVQAGQAITRAGRGVEKALRAFLHARRQTRMIERLYEKDYELFKTELRKREQQAQDELTVLRWRFSERGLEEAGA